MRFFASEEVAVDLGVRNVVTNSEWEVIIHKPTSHSVIRSLDGEQLLTEVLNSIKEPYKP